MEELPDDVLLILMRYLRLPDLFACRVVCKRFKHLALHPDVWRHRSLKSHLAKDKPNPWVCPVLRLAPCLAELTAELPSVGCHGQLLAMSRCAASCLRVTARWSGIKDAAFMIRNQEALGRLRHLDLSFGSYDASFGKEGSLIMGVVAAATSRLEHLNVPIFRVDSYELAASSVSHCLITNSSLRSLKCPLTPSSEPFSKTILTAHSSTLEVVRFSLIEFKATPWTNAGAGPLLASMPHLRKLLSPLLPGMESGPACESLTQVDLFLQPDTPACARAAVGVLRRAKQLSKVVLHFSVASPAHISADLLADLAAGRSRATVNTLVVSLPEERDELPGGQPPQHPQVLSLMRALPALTALRTLQVGSECDELLQAITPDTAPALRTLALWDREAARLEINRCVHGWLHRPAVKELFSRNPSLQLLLFYRNVHCSEAPMCPACEEGCHRGLTYDRIRSEIEDHGGRLMFRHMWLAVPRDVPA